MGERKGEWEGLQVGDGGVDEETESGEEDGNERKDERNRT